MMIFCFRSNSTSESVIDEFNQSVEDVKFSFSRNSIC